MSAGHHRRWLGVRDSAAIYRSKNVACALLHRLCNTTLLPGLQLLTALCAQVFLGTFGILNLLTALFVDTLVEAHEEERQEEEKNKKKRRLLKIFNLRDVFQRLDTDGVSWSLLCSASVPCLRMAP